VVVIYEIIVGDLLPNTNALIRFVVDAEAAVVTNKDSSIGCQADVALLIGDNARMGVMAKLRRVFAATHIAVRVV
jgi:hypothetical protein